MRYGLPNEGTTGMIYTESVGVIRDFKERGCQVTGLDVK